MPGVGRSIGDGSVECPACAKDETVWRGETLAEIGYWDAAGAERSQPLNAASGWKMERRPAEHGCRLVCRQETLGFSITLDFSATGDVLTVSVPAGDVVESGPARLKTLRLLPRFGAASEGDAGYLVIAQQSGASVISATSSQASTGCRSTRVPASAQCRCSAWCSHTRCRPAERCRARLPAAGSARRGADGPHGDNDATARGEAVADRLAQGSASRRVHALPARRCRELRQGGRL